MDFDKAAVEAIAADRRRLNHFSNYTTGMGGYEISHHSNHAGVPYVARRILGGPLKGKDVLVLGPGTTFELDEFWREDARRVVGIDINTRVFDYRLEYGYDDADVPFPATPTRAERQKRWQAYVKGTGMSEHDLLAAFNLFMMDGNPKPYLSEESKEHVRELRSQALRVTTKEEFERERDLNSQSRTALLDKPLYAAKNRGLESSDGRVVYTEGYAEEQLTLLGGVFDLVSAVALFEEGKMGPPEQMTEYKMWVSRRGEGRMADPVVIPKVVQGAANHLAVNGAFLVKTIHNPTFLQPAHFEPHGLVAENYNTRTPDGWFTILKKH